MTFTVLQCDSYEPNNSPDQATSINMGGSISDADICPSGDEDYYKFTGAGGDKIVVDIDAMIDGSSLDPVIYLFDSDGDYAGNRSTYASGDGDVHYTVQICPVSPDNFENDDDHLDLLIMMTFLECGLHL